MLYGIAYLYRLTDFLSIVADCGSHHILFTSYWSEHLELKNSSGRPGPNTPADQTEALTIDYHELAFMGVFGIGYKMIVQGDQGTGCLDSQDNKELFETAKEIKDHVVKVWNEEGFKAKLQKRPELVIRPGVLVRLCRVESAFVPLDKFLVGKIPETVPYLRHTQKDL